MALAVSGLLNKPAGGELGISEVTGESTSRPGGAKDDPVVIHYLPAGLKRCLAEVRGSRLGTAIC